jgi:HK97 family phage major capsid protein
MATNIDARKSTAIKLLGENRIGGYGAVWGDAQNTDLEGDYFTHETNFWLDTYQNQPALYDHALSLTPGGDDSAEAVRIGTVKAMRPDEIGLWVEAVIEDHNDWVAAVQELINKGVLYWSSGSVPHMVRRAEDGRIKSWPIIEMSATPTPAEPRNTKVVPLKHYVNNQTEQKPEAAPVKGGAGQNGASVDSTETEEMTSQEVNMTLQLSELTAKAVIEAYAKAEHDNIVAAVDDAVKQGGGNMIAESLQPLADQLAELAGTDTEAALSVLVAYVAENVMGAPEPEEEPVPEEMMSAEEQPAMLNISQSKLDEMLQQAVQKAVGSDTAAGGFKTKNVNVNKNREENKPLTLGRYIKAVSQNRFDILERYAPRIKAAHKALGINPDTAGGYLVPVEQSNQIIELLRAQSTVLPLCRTVPMNRDVMTIPTQTGGATAYWVGENSQITASEETFGQKMLVAKKLAVLVKLSNELLDDSDPAVDALIREDIATVAALKVDNAILVGGGVGNEPLGVLNAGVTTTALNAAVTYANISQAVSRVEQENVVEAPPWQWVINPREMDTLRQMEDTAGNLVFSGGGQYQQAIAGVEPTTLLGYPLNKTTTVAVDTDNNDETRMYFGQWKDVVVGQRKSLEIMATNQGGDSFEYDQTWIRAILRMDVIIRHPESIEILTDVRAAS